MAKKINLMIAGCTGRMGRMILELLPEYEGFTLVKLTEQQGHKDIGISYSMANTRSDYDLVITDGFSENINEADVIIDFTTPESTMDLLEYSKEMNVSHIIGTTGFTIDQEARISSYAVNKVIVKAGNMSLGVNLITKLTEVIANTLDSEFDIEILEMHHKNKIDAPSGTAIMLGNAAARGRGVSLEEVKDFDRTKAREKRKLGNIGLSSLRGGDVVGDHSVIFAGNGERIVINHVATNREIFARGALKAATWTLQKKPSLYNMIDVLGL